MVFHIMVEGKNKDSRNPVWDYSEGARRVAPFADYLVINVSSPNTPGLRDLQKKTELTAIVKSVQVCRICRSVFTGSETVIDK